LTLPTADNRSQLAESNSKVKWKHFSTYQASLQCAYGGLHLRRIPCVTQIQRHPTEPEALRHGGGNIGFKVAINGLGRIGRATLKIVMESPAWWITLNRHASRRASSAFVIASSLQEADLERRPRSVTDVQRSHNHCQQVT
jgi:hypothetical protein